MEVFPISHGSEPGVFATIQSTSVTPGRHFPPVMENERGTEEENSQNVFSLI